MRITRLYLILLAWLPFTSTASHAAIVTLDSPLFTVSFDSSSMGYLGFPEISGTTLVFRPSLQISAPANEIYYSDFLPYGATLDVQAKPGFSVLGYRLTASGSSYVGDDASMGISGTFEKWFWGASYYSGAMTGAGPWSVSRDFAGPTLPTIAGEIYIETVNHYSYELGTLVQVPVFEEVAEEEIVGWEPSYDEFGQQNGASPIIEIRYVQKIVRYDWVPQYETIYQTSGGSFSLDNLTIQVSTASLPLAAQVSAVPLPPASLLFLSALGLMGSLAKRLPFGLRRSEQRKGNDPESSS